MNSLQVNSILRGDQALKQVFTGVYPIDTLPQCTSVPAALVINLDKHDEEGSHCG